ncbi:MAG: hypothetical protein Q9200_007364, partial [Gallowayella weberi]
MPNAIKPMKRKRHRDPKLQQHLHGRRQLGERGRERRGFEMPAEKGGDEVEGAEGVEGAGEDGARDAVEGGE